MAPKRIEVNMNTDAADILTDRSRTMADGQAELEFTGERIVPGKTDEALFREHEERYVFAAKYVSGKEVLDVASGTGVGTSFLRAAGARKARGVDVDPKAIAYARARYPDCEFEQGDAAHLRLADESVDVVVSFETLEHLNDQAKFLSECRRVLRPGGVLICSTPNRKVYGWYGTNPYHTHELTANGFAGLLAEEFDAVALFSQREKFYPVFVLRRIAWRFFTLLRLEEALSKLRGMNATNRSGRESFSIDGQDDPERVRPYRRTWLRQPMYLIAVSSCNGRWRPNLAGYERG